jgi:hypothetical protein
MQIGPSLGVMISPGASEDRHGHDDADHVLIGGQDDRDEAVAIGDRLLHAVENSLFLLTQGMAIHPLVGDDRKLRGVDRIVPSRRTLRCGPFWPPLTRNLRAS